MLVCVECAGQFVECEREEMPHSTLQHCSPADRIRSGFIADVWFFESCGNIPLFQQRLIVVIILVEEKRKRKRKLVLSDNPQPARKAYFSPLPQHFPVDNRRKGRYNDGISYIHCTAIFPIRRTSYGVHSQ